MNGIDDRYSSSDEPDMAEGAPHGFWYAAMQFLLGIIGLTVITFAAIRLHLQPGAISLLYVMVVVFVSLRTGIVSAVAFSLIAVFFLNYDVIPLFASPGTKNPLPLFATPAFLITAWVITAMVARVRKLTEAQVTLRFEERLAERTRIARELHDTLLQSFQALMLRFQAVNNLLPPGKERKRSRRLLIGPTRPSPKAAMRSRIYVLPQRSPMNWPRRSPRWVKSSQKPTPARASRPRSAFP